MAVSSYNAIGTFTLSSAQPQITFSNIPQIYTDLVLVMNGKLSSGGFIAIPMYFNGDTRNLYSRTYMYGDGTNTPSGRTTSNTSMQLPYWTSSEISMTVIQIMNYSNNTVFKTALNRNQTNTTTTGEVGLYRSTSAISSLTISPSGVNFASGSTFSLYGIGANQLKASGGDIIVSDGTYWYHAFKTSGTFTPLSTLSCDYLVVAGGGSGGADGSTNYTAWGGGGAGGLRSATSQSLTATGYAVVIGAGGAGGGGAYGQGGNAGSNSSFNSLTSAGGGGGAKAWHNNGSTGGSGGGGAGTYTLSSTTGGAGNTPSTSPSQGNNGGGGSYGGSNQYAGGGGGGAGAVGATTTTDAAGNGGVGSSAFSAYGLATGTGENISGTSYYAGGGGGASRIGTQGSGGYGGGSKGAGLEASNGFSSNALANTGGGSGSAITAGNGGSGIVIVRYPI